MSRHMKNERQDRPVCVFVFSLSHLPALVRTIDLAYRNCNENITHNTGMKIESERYFNQNNFPSPSQARL